MSGKHVFGMILILLGLGFLLDQFDVISFGNIFSTYWPMIIIVIGVTNLFNKDSSKFGNTIIILVGVMFQINALNILSVSVAGLIFPLVLILVGMKVLFSRKKESNYKYNLNEDIYSIDQVKGTESNDKNDSTVKLNRNISADNVIDVFAFMSGVETNNRSHEFKGGKATAIMGSIEIDLRGAVLYGNIAELELTSIMGSIEIIIPENWRVEVRGTPLLGEISNKSIYNTDPNAPILRIKGFVLMGSIEIK